MPKILRAIGQKGRINTKHWNWCPGEPVGVHGMVCCNSDVCGCNRSFVGVRSSKSCTVAIVEEVTKAEYKVIRKELYDNRMKGWGNNKEIANEAVEMFDNLSADLKVFDVGMIVSCTKTDDEVITTEVRGDVFEPDNMTIPCG